MYDVVSYLKENNLPYITMKDGDVITVKIDTKVKRV